MTEQPVWKLIAQLGDAHPIEYGGYFILQDTTGVYPEEGEWLESPETDEGKWEVRRFSLDRLKLVNGYLVLYTHNFVEGFLVSKHVRPGTMHVSRYDEWFHKDLDRVAASYGSDEITLTKLREAFCSADPLDRAFAYRLIGEHHGFDNLDEYPLILTRKEVDERYSQPLYNLIPS